MKDDKNEPMPGRGDRLLEVTRGQNERQKCGHTKGGMPDTWGGGSAEMETWESERGGC